ncbi:MAG TPA: hybrid sensor histidine kinase/response regulator [Bryobacteraceae bacterium]|nr:hybrid sensor histidine kinase/response regulator [Bryobacteraceae bacterium]
MSEPNIEDEIILEYLAECREHLTTIEADLLSMEQSGAAIDEQLVNRVFRAAHSIKGGAGFFDLHKIKELGHRTENVLDMVRSGQMIPNSEIVSILLLAFDKLRTLIQDYAESNDADISEFTDALSRLAEEHLEPDQKHSTQETITISIPNGSRRIAASAFDLQQARRAGKNVYVIEYDLIHDIQRRGQNPLEVLNNLMKCGEIISTEFDLESAGTLDQEPSDTLLLDVLYSTALDGYSLSQVLDLRVERIHLTNNDGAVKTVQAREAVAVAVAVPAAPAALSKKPDAPSVVPEFSPALADEHAEGAQKPVHAAQTWQAETTVRLNVALLDSLMTLAGELVLGRNQLNEAVRNGDKEGIAAGAYRVSLVTSELQGAVSLTRMQPVSSLFAKFPRLVRDLASQLGKEVQLKLEGGEVELDKTILEGLSDPLTHMVRNSVDHGVESPAARVAAKKPVMGTVVLAARHQAGQVVIEISDDGKGLAGDKIGASAVAKGMITAEQLQKMSDYEKQELIFMPGVSTAEKLSNVSGRGVGMDVVKTNLDRLGGKVEIDSVPGRGSAFRIKLPLTLAIIPSLLVSDSGERFAIPQVSVGELIRIPADQIEQRTDRAGDAELVLLRNRLVPMVYLSDALGSPRAERGSRALNIVLVDAGAIEYGLVVGELHDTVEIVVKPMGRHLQGLVEYAGATILGDGQVAVILDVAGLAARAGLSRAANPTTTVELAADDNAAGEIRSLLLFQNAPGEDCAVPIELVTRVERVRAAQVENLGGRRTMQYGGVSLPLVALHDVASVDELVESQQWVVVVFDCAGQTLGLLAAEPLDMVETRVVMDTQTLRQPGVAGSALLNGRTTLMLDIFELAGKFRRAVTEPEPSRTAAVSQELPPQSATILVAEDSDFFRGQIQRLIEGVGYKVLTADDGQSAWEMLDSHASEISLVTTDIEMPRLDGLGLTKRIRADARFDHLPIIALSTLASEEEMAHGLSVGLSEYQVKLDQDQLIQSIGKALSGADLRKMPVTA